MKQARTYGYLQDSKGTRHRVTSQAVAAALKEADERVQNLKVLAERYAAQAEDSERKLKKLHDSWWVAIGVGMGIVKL